MKKLFRTIHPEVRVLDEKKGIVEYVASDETPDSYKEIIRAKGWRFDHFKKNAPFVDSHDYSTIENLLGKILDFAVRGGKLIETAQWAIDVPDARLARYGFDMTSAGYLKAVSVGFFPIKYASRYDTNLGDWQQQLTDLNLPKDTDVRTIYTEQQQIELSACVIGANPNALAKAYKTGVINDDALEFLAGKYTSRETAAATDDPDGVATAQRQAREKFATRLRRIAAQF